MEVHHLLVDEGTVALLGVLLGRVPEVTTADGLLDPHSSFPTRHYVQLVSEKMTECVTSVTLVQLCSKWRRREGFNAEMYSGEAGKTKLQCK